MGSGKYLLYAQKKYGIENFEKEILYILNTPEEMYHKEAEIVNEEFICSNNTYNIKLGGYGGFDYLNSSEFCNSTHSFEHLSKMGMNSSGFTGKTHSTETKSKLRERAILNRKSSNKFGFEGLKHSEESKQKMRQSAIGKHIGSKNSQYGTMWITNGVENKKINKIDIIPETWYKGRKL